MKADEYARLDATALAELIRTRQVSQAEVLEAARERIAARNPRINAVIAMFKEPAEGAKDGPFAGVPFLLKDIGAGLAGVPTIAACRYLKAAPPQAEDDELTRRFRRAGLSILGKTNLPELGFNVTTEPQLNGPTLNPWNPECSAGGSSGGSAAAVAAGLVPVAHATDGAGSIRIPAAACGLVGLKPSRGALPQGPGHADIYGGLVSEGVVSRTVRDTAGLLDALWGADAGAPYAAPDHPRAMQIPGRLRIGLNKECPDDCFLDPEAVEVMEAAGRLLEGLGHAVEHVSLPLAPEDLLAPRRVYLAQVCAQAAADVEELCRIVGHGPRADEMEAINRAAAARGRTMPAADYLAAVRAGHAFSRRFARVWATADVLITPALAGPAPPLGSFPTDHEDVALHVARMLRFSPFTAAFNVTGDPAIVVPVRLSREGLPLGVQLLAPLGHDGTLLGLAAEMEAALGGPDHLVHPWT